MSQYVADTPLVAQLTLTAQSTEYSYTLPKGTQKVMFKVRDGTLIYYAFVTGKVAGPTADYGTLMAGAVYNLDGINNLYKDVIIYFSCPSAIGKIVEIETWS